MNSLRNFTITVTLRDSPSLSVVTKGGISVLGKKVRRRVPFPKGTLCKTFYTGVYKVKGQWSEIGVQSRTGV